jgi:hypothetical protein
MRSGMRDWNRGCKPAGGGGTGFFSAPAAESLRSRQGVWAVAETGHARTIPQRDGTDRLAWRRAAAIIGREAARGLPVRSHIARKTFHPLAAVRRTSTKEVGT